MDKGAWDDIYTPTGIVLSLAALLGLAIAFPAVGLFGWACLAVVGIVAAIRQKRGKHSK